MWDNAASVDMKIGFEPVIADYEVGLDTIAEWSFILSQNSDCLCRAEMHSSINLLCAILMSGLCCQNMALEPKT